MLCSTSEPLTPAKTCVFSTSEPPALKRAARAALLSRLHSKNSFGSTSEPPALKKKSFSSTSAAFLIFPSESQHCFELYFVQLHMSPEGDICKSTNHAKTRMFSTSDPLTYLSFGVTVLLRTLLCSTSRVAGRRHMQI